MKTIAIVTGASSGIGKEFFLSLNERKQTLDEIWVVARSEDKLQALQAQTDVPVRVFALDLSSSSSISVLDAALQAEQPQIEYLICASGFGRFNAVEDDQLSTLENMIDLNCKGVVAVTKTCAPFMKKGGAMLLIASISALQPVPYITTYAATKAFVLSYGRAFDKELRKTRGARVLSICPFWTKKSRISRVIATNTRLRATGSCPISVRKKTTPCSTTYNALWIISTARAGKGVWYSSAKGIGTTRLTALVNLTRAKAFGFRLRR
jgi:short-subunit dehydrogenase